MVLQKKGPAPLRQKTKKEFESLSGEPLISTSRRMELEKELLEQFHLQEQIFSLVPVPLVMKDANSVYLHVNQAFADFLGLPREQVLGKGPFDLFSPEFAQRIFEEDQEIIRNGVPATDLERRIKDGHGKMVWLKSYKGPVFNSSGGVIGIVGGNMDITAVKNAEEALRKSEERWKFAVEGAGDGVSEWNLETGDVFYSKQWKAMLGYKDDEIAPTFEEQKKRIHPDDLSEVMRALEQHLRGETPSFSHEFRMATKNGGWIWVLDRAKVIEWSDDGAPLRMIGIYTDITRRKSAEEMILHQATHDMLTGLPNRMLFNDRLFMAMADGKRLGRKTALIFLDLDNFKTVNDTLGHQMGDLLLMAVAERLSKEIREIDTLARFGGDEFAFVIPFLENKEGAAALADRIQQSLCREFRIDGKSLFITGSMGVAFHPDDSDDLETIMKQADMAMYRSKREGRNAWRFWG